MLRPGERNSVHVGVVGRCVRAHTALIWYAHDQKTSNGPLMQKIPSSTIEDHKGTIGTFAAICDF
jgi:hypothetical protein